MRPRTELALACGAFFLLLLLAVATGRRTNISTDQRASSTVTGPTGTRALAEVFEATGGRVTRWTRRLQRLDSARATGATIVVMQPVVALSAEDALHLLELQQAGTHLLVTGGNTGVLLRCLGYDVDVRVRDSARVRGPSGRERVGTWTTLVTVPDTARTIVGDMGERVACPSLAAAPPEPLLRTTDDSLVAVIMSGTDGSGSITVLATPSLLSNRGLQTTEIPEFLVGAMRARSDHLIFDEFHQSSGGGGGSMATVALAWSATNPLGWMMWQLLIVGLLAFLATGLRFGPVRARIERQRRSPLEHVKALATALGASKGHDVAVAALVRGLRRRLAATSGEARRRGLGRDTWRAWLDALPQRMTDPAQRALAERLVRLGAPGQTDAAVYTAAHTVEDVWEALHH